MGTDEKLNGTEVRGGQKLDTRGEQREKGGAVRGSIEKLQNDNLW